MNQRNSIKYDVWRPGNKDAYGETPYSDSSIDIEANIVTVASNQATDEVSARVSNFMGLTAYKDLKANDMLVNSTDKYVITSVNTSPRLTQFYCTKQA